MAVGASASDGRKTLAVKAPNSKSFLRFSGIPLGLEIGAWSFFSFQTAGFPGPVQDGLGNAARFGGAIVEDPVDLVEVGGEFGALRSGGGKIVPIVFK